MSEATMSEATTAERTDELVVAIPPQKALDVFVGGAESIDPFLADVRRLVEEFQPDVNTANGRAAIASVARKVASYKVRLDDMGKGLVAKQKEIPNKIDATRRHIRETLDKLRDDVRRPLTEWETVEDDRKQRQLNLLNEILLAGQQGNSAFEISAVLSSLEVFKPAPGDDEQFAGRVALAKESARATLEQRLRVHEQHEAERAELARLREIERQQQQVEREERMKRESAEHAAAKARAEADAEIRKANEAARAAEAKAEAERRAIEDERQRESKRKAAEEAEKAARERDVAHRAEIQAQARRALLDAGIKANLAQVVIDMIAARQVPHVSIQY